MACSVLVLMLFYVHLCAAAQVNSPDKTNKLLPAVKYFPFFDLLVSFSTLVARNSHMIAMSFMTE